jgi:uncharacterized delta-60 repeat protein
MKRIFQINEEVRQRSYLILFAIILSSVQLQAQICGNGILEAGEACDDGNLVAGDGCDPTCQLPPLQVAENDFGYNIGGTGFNGAVNASALQADGKLVVGGAFTSFNGMVNSTGPVVTTTRNYIARLNTDGTLDNTFNAGTTLNGSVSSIAIEAAGNILVAGTFGGTIKRLTSAGAVAGGGDTFTAGTFNNVVYSIAIQPGDGKIIVVGNFTTYTYTPSTTPIIATRNRILRLETNGNLDANTFDPASVGLNGIVRCVAVTSLGQVVVGGSFTSPRFYYARLNADGTLDAAFNSGAFGSTVAAASAVYALAFQANGQVIAGGIYFNGSSYLGATRRLSATGTNDGTFVAPEYSGLIVKSLAVQSDGKIISGGEFSQGIARYTSTGAIDAFVAGNGFTGTEIKTLAIQADGKITAGGSYTAYNDNPRNNIARLTACPSVGISTQPTNQGICLSSTGAFSLVASGTGLTYQWQYAVNNTSAFSNLTNSPPYSGVTTSTLTLTGVTAPMSGYIYRCIVKDATCNTTSGVATLTVNSVQAISVDPVNKSACVGTSTSFTATVTGSQGGFQWQEDQGSGFVNLANGGVYSNVNQSTLNLTGVTVAMNNYKYRLVAGLCSPAVTSNFATLTVDQTPVIISQPAGQTLCAVTSTSLSVTATGAGLSYQWQYYTGSSTYANLTNGVEAATNFKFGGTYAGVTSATLTISGITQNVAPTDPAIYRCIISSGTCGVISTAANIYRYATPTISTQPTDVSKCNGTSGNVTFTVATTSIPTGLTYQWQEKVGTGSFTNLTNGGVYSTVTAATLTLTGVTAGMNGNQYRCVVGACSPSVISFAAQLVVDSPPVVTLQPVASTICTGMGTTFSTNATGLGVTFQWQKETGINFGSYANITNGGIYSGATTATLTLTNVPVTESGLRYRCVATASGVCAAVNTSNVLLTVRAVPTFTTQPLDQTACEGQTKTISTSVNFNGAPAVYQWQVDEFGIAFTDIQPNLTLYPNGVNGASLTIASTLLLNGYKYRLRVGTCTPDVFSNAVTLTVNRLPTVTSSPANKTICAGGNTTFSVTAVGTGLTYQWLRETVTGTGFSTITDGTNYSGATTATLTITAAPGTFNNYNYQCRVSGTCTPSATSTPATLIVNEAKITTQPISASGCVGDTKSFSIVASGAASYQWQEDKGQGFANLANGGIYSNATTSALTLTGITAAMTGYKYQCVIASLGTCASVTSTAQTLTVTSPTKPTIIVAGAANPEAPILTLSSGGGTSYQWFKNGAAIAGATGSSYTITSEGSYTLQVTLNGCVSPMSDAQVMIITGDIGNLATSPISLYPNPGSDYMTLSLGGFEKDKPVSISIINLQGQVMEKTTGLGQHEVSIDVRDFAAGVYLVWLQQQSVKASKQFIKSN